MSTSSPTLEGFNFDLGDLARALRGEFIAEVEAEPFEDNFEELRSVARGIAGTHVDVIAQYVRLAFASKAAASDTLQFTNALRSLARLAEASGDRRQHDLLEQMRTTTETVATRTSRRDKDRFLRELREFVDGFADCLHGDDAARLKKLVSYDRSSTPLLAVLANVPGVGAKRLERLYCAQLHTVDTVARSAPEDVAAVTGLPLTLAAEVVKTARDYARSECLASIEAISARTDVLIQMSQTLAEPLPADAITRLTTALEALQEAFTPRTGVDR